VSLARFACGRIAGVVMNFLSVHLVLLFLFFAFLLLSLIGVLIITRQTAGASVVPSDPGGATMKRLIVVVVIAH
jgi:hypothetical protein